MYLQYFKIAYTSWSSEFLILNFHWTALYGGNIKNAVIISSAYLGTFNVGCLKVATPQIHYIRKLLCIICDSI